MCQTPSKRRTDGQTRTATTSDAIVVVTPCRRRCDSLQTDGQTDAAYTRGVRPSVRPFLRWSSTL